MTEEEKNAKRVARRLTGRWVTERRIEPLRPMPIGDMTMLGNEEQVTYTTRRRFKRWDEK